MSLFEQMLEKYSILTKDEERNAIHEVMQQITLAGLYRGNFFDKAAFYGGTCLRIFYNSQRFSEDMDFSLLRHDSTFKIENYFDAIVNEFKACGKDITITKKDKTKTSSIESAFLKENTETYTISFQTEKQIKVRLEVDTDPPSGFQTEPKLLLLPFSFMTSCFVLPDLFAGKMHALLFRNWKNRVKGRDWYDFEWYIRNGIELNFNHFKIRSLQTNKDLDDDFGILEFKELLQAKIRTVNIEQIKSDVYPFIKNNSEIDIWSNNYFMQLAELIRIQTTFL